MPEPYADLAAATQIAFEAHAQQFRKNKKTPYIFHPIQVTQLLIEWGVGDVDVLVAAICHDILEDCDPKYQKILADQLSPSAYSYVEEMTRAEDVSKEEYLRSFQDKQVPTILIKLADRICNTEDFLRYRKSSGIRYWSAGEPIVKAFYDKVEKSLQRNIIQNANRDIDRINRSCG